VAHRAPITNLLAPVPSWCAGRRIIFGREKQFTTNFGEAEMARFAHAVRRFVGDEEGAALAEYGILVAFIAIVAITAVTFFGSKISTKFSEMANHFS
jgi:pilus assembly protein Flp/PilA